MYFSLKIGCCAGAREHIVRQVNMCGKIYRAHHGEIVGFVGLAQTKKLEFRNGICRKYFLSHIDYFNEVKSHHALKFHVHWKKNEEKEKEQKIGCGMLI